MKLNKWDIYYNISNVKLILFLYEENADKQKQSNGADEVYVMLIQQLLKPDDKENLMAGKILSYPI